MTIGELARRTGVNLETVRFYERIGLLPKPKRRPSGYRVYSEADIRRLEFVKAAKAVGFSLREIAELMELRVDPQNTCDQVRARAEEKIRQIDEKIQELTRIRHALEVLAASCRGKGPQDPCPILQALEAVDASREGE